MAENGTLDWTKNEQEISVAVNYDDPSATPPLKVTPGQPDALVKAAELNAKQMATKMYGKDVRATLAQWILLSGTLTQLGIMSLQDFDQSLKVFTAGMNTRMGDVEHRQTTTEATVTATLKDMTDKAAETGEGYGPEVVDARHSDIYGKDYDTVGEHIRAIEAAIAPYIASTSATATIPVNLGRQVPISVSYYEYAIGTEPDGLGTGPYGLGGSEPQDVSAIAVTWTDSNTANVALPVTYKDVVANGTLKAMADGSWTLTDGYKTLRFVADA